MAVATTLAIGAAVGGITSMVGAQVKKNEAKKDLYGGFSIEDCEYAQEQLWIMDFNEEDLFKTMTPTEAKDSTFLEAIKPQLLIDTLAFTITDFEWSPDGKKIAFDHQPNPFIVSFMKSDISDSDSARGFLSGGTVGSQAKVSRSKWDSFSEIHNFLASVDLPELEFPNITIFLNAHPPTTHNALHSS